LIVVPPFSRPSPRQFARERAAGERFGAWPVWQVAPSAEPAHAWWPCYK